MDMKIQLVYSRLFNLEKGKNASTVSMATCKLA